MKPDWKDAPKWANWLAQDADGYWVWYQEKPSWVKEIGEWCTPTGSVEVSNRTPSFENSLEQRT